MDEMKVECLKNARGDDVAVDLIPEWDLKRHRVVESIFDKIEKLHDEMERVSAEINAEIDKYLAGVVRKAKAGKEEIRGNLDLSNYSQTKQVKIVVNDFFSFDERLNLAKLKIDSCIKRWSEGENSANARYMKTIVSEAFNVDKKGAISKTQLFRLLKVNIADREWVDAQKLIRDSMSLVESKKYKNFRVKQPGRKWESLNLNFSTF